MSPSQFFFSEDSKNALTKEMVDIVLGKATGCLTTQKKPKKVFPLGLSMSINQIPMYRFFA